MRYTMSMIDWETEIYDNWRRACGKTASFQRRDYHDWFVSGQHTLKEGAGAFNFASIQELFCLHYDELVNNELHGSRTLSNHKATRRCDYVLFSREGKEELLSQEQRSLCMLVDITSTIGATTKRLDTQIDKHSGLTKSEKVPEQILHTLRALKLCDSISDYIADCPELSHRIAVCAYTLGVSNQSRDAFNRPIEKGQSRGATIYPHKELNQDGFSYHKIEYPNVLTIPIELR